MSLLNPTFNNGDSWKALLRKAMSRIEVDLNEVERVIEIARRTPGLASYESCFRQLSIFFDTATKYYRDKSPQSLKGILEFWERYRSAVIQRYTALTPVELNAADKVVANVFDRFILNIPPENIAYFQEARPLVYGGEGGLGGYFTHPPGWNRPFAIINLPHAAFDNVWHWLALPHETGHDLYAVVEGLEKELTEAVGKRMINAVANGEVQIPDVSVDLSAYGLPIITYTGPEFLAKVWCGWVNELQADLVGVLNCGGAAIAALQHIIGFDTKDYWFMQKDSNGNLNDYPEPHPTSYIRNVFNIEALRLIDNGSHTGLADELEKRFNALKPGGSEIVWQISEGIVFAKMPISEMKKAAKIAAELFCTHKLNTLGSKSYPEIGTFTANDQSIVTALINPLLNGDSTFMQIKDNPEPRHALAATILAMEKDSDKAHVINKTFKHFV